MRIDEVPTHKLNGVRYSRGHAMPFGATIVSPSCVNFSVNSCDATDAALVLFHSGEKEPFAEIPFPHSFRTGSNFSMLVYDIDIEDIEYGYRFDGPYKPQEGYRFDRSKILLDPYAKLISGNETWGTPHDGGSVFPFRGKVPFTDFDWEDDQQLGIPFNQLIIYELHVRGYTIQDPNNRCPGTYAGLIDKIPYLKQLGVNCVELLPVFEFDERERDIFDPGSGVINYWGYSTIGFFAPKASYAKTGPFGMTVDEFKNMVKQFHNNNIEIILDVVFNHTAEMSGKRTVSYSGIDNRTYYLLNPDGTYCNFSGCGNTVNCNNSIVRNHILDCLRYWVSDYHIDGFRFDEAPILSRNVNGEPMKKPPLLEMLAQDPVLVNTKLIAEAWDAAGLYQVGSFPAPDKWSDWNGRFRDSARRFVKGDGFAGREMIYRIQGSPDVYPTRKNSSASVNFITCHDGFTMYDLVSYNEKHNESNGENNRDGLDDNDSWNCGAEGPTDDPAILLLRRRQVKNMLTLLLLSRGVPMLLAGDEFLNSQSGNNNAYCHDSPLSWLDWNDLEKHSDVFEYVKNLIDIRKSFPVITRKDYYSGINTTGFPELSFHGTKPWELDRTAPMLSFGFMYAQPGFNCTYGDSFIYCAVNEYWEPQEYTLPKLPPGMSWTRLLYSAEAMIRYVPVTSEEITLEARSSMVLIGYVGPGYRISSLPKYCRPPKENLSEM